MHLPTETPFDPLVSRSNDRDGLEYRNSEMQTPASVEQDVRAVNKEIRHDPLNILPPEIWLQCLADVVNDNSINLLPLLLVSRAWCNTLVSSAPLWTHIYVRDTPDYVNCMHKALFFSRALPLCVTIEVPMINAIDGQPHPIWKETHRLRELVFKRNPSRIRNSSTLDVHLMDLFYEGVYTLLKGIEQLPVLEWITLNHAFDYYSLSMTKRDFPSTPRLKGIKFWCISEEALTSLQLEELTYMSSSSPMRDLCPSLPQLKQLQRLILTQVGEGGEDSSFIPNISPHLLPQLHALEFYQDSPQSIVPFLSVETSTLIELQVKLSWQELEKLAPHLANLTRLQYLHFILKSPQQELQSFEPLFPPLHHVHRFQLEQQSPAKATDDNENPSSKASNITSSSLIAHRHMVSLLDACRLNMTGIRNILLVLNDEIPTKTLLELIGAMSFLNKLEFKGQLTKEENLHLVAPSLEEIVLANETLLRYLRVPNALCIYIAAAEVDGHSGISVLEAPSLRTLTINSSLTSAIRAGVYHDLNSLTWLDPGGGCASTVRSFSSLTRVLFDHSSPRKECNDFCELILRYPASCRGLDTLEMRAYPEWDILLHMVQRRNFLSNPEIAMITTLKLPGFPAPSLLVPLTDLLGRRIPKIMPPIDELCLSRVDGPYFDVNVYVWVVNHPLDTNDPLGWAAKIASIVE